MRLKGNKKLWIAIGVLAFAISSAFFLNHLFSLKRDLRNLKVQQTELLLLKGEFLSLKSRIDAVEGRKSLTKAEGIVQAIDQVFLSLGLKQKVKSVKPTGKREIKDAVEEEAEIQLEKVDMNEMVNIFYKAENAPTILTIKRTTTKTSFESSSLLNITMTVALIKQK